MFCFECLLKHNHTVSCWIYTSINFSWAKNGDDDYSGSGSGSGGGGGGDELSLDLQIILAVKNCRFAIYLTNQ